MSERIRKFVNNEFEENENNDFEFISDLKDVPTGIVSLNGVFIPCKFGEHEFLAKRICNDYKIKLDKINSYLDVLVKKGFVILRSMPLIGYYASFYSFNNITEKQFKTINNIEKKFDVKFDFGLDEYKEIF